MKAWDIIKAIRTTDDVRATKMLEDIFMSGYVNGVNKGYVNVFSLIKLERVEGDVERGRRTFIKKYL